jgi:Predicted acyltransferase
MVIESFGTSNCKISSDKSLLQFDRVMDMMGKTYWAKNRSEDKMHKAIDNSICYGVYLGGVQIGFARVITDFATTFYIADLVIDEEQRGKGLGKKLVAAIVGEEELKPLFGMLVTADAHGLYEQYGFIKDGKIFMYRRG